MKAGKTTLTTRVVKSAKWVFIGRILVRGFELIKLVVLARILVPEDFGLFGLVMLTVIIVDTFSQTGINTALVQKKENVDDYLNTAWVIQIIRGVGIGLLILVLAPIVGVFFNEPRIVPMLRVISFAPMVHGFVNIAIIYFEKELQFHKRFIYDVVSSLISFIFALLLAYIYKSVWALIWANILGFVVRLMLSYAIHNYRPQLQFSKHKAKELFRFGKWMTGFSVVQFGWQQFDKIIIGKILGPVPLGIFQMAQRIADLPVSNLVVSSVNFTFPAYSQIQEDIPRLRRAFLDVFEIIISLVIPFAVFIAVAATDIVIGVLTEKWGGIIIPLQLLAVAAVFSSMDIILTPLFLGVGKPNIEFTKSLVRMVVMVMTIVPCTFLWGIHGACISLIISTCCVLPFWIISKKYIGFEWGEIGVRLLYPVINGVAIAGAITIIHFAVGELGLLSLIYSCMASIFSFIFITVLWGHWGKCLICDLGIKFFSDLNIRFNEFQ